MTATCKVAEVSRENRTHTSTDRVEDWDVGEHESPKLEANDVYCSVL